MGYLLRRIKTILVLFILLLISGCQSSCEDSLGCLQIPANQVISIGIEHITTGEQISLTEELQRVMKNEISKLASPNFPKVDLFIVDTPCTNSSTANSAAAFLNNPQVVAVFGPICNKRTFEFQKTITDGGLVVISLNEDRIVQSMEGNFSQAHGSIEDQAIFGLEAILPSIEKVAIKNLDGSIWIPLQAFRSSIKDSYSQLSR